MFKGEWKLTFMNAVINKKETGLRIKKARETSNCDMTVIEQIMDLKKYKLIERGCKIPTVYQLVELSKAFNVKMDDLLSFKIENWL